MAIKLAPNQVNIGTLEKPNIITAPTASTPTQTTTPLVAPAATTAFSAEQPLYTVKAGDKFNPYNGQPLNNAPVGTTIMNPFGTPATAKAAVSPEDQRLIDMGVSPEDLAKLNTPEGMEPGSFQNLIGNIENKLKTNNELVTQRGYLIKHLYDDKLTKEELKALPEDIQKIVKNGDQDTIQLQIRLLNDQIAGRANTLSQSIGYLAEGYKTSVAQAEKQKTDAISTVLDFVGAYGSKAPQVLSSLYGQQYLDKLKEMGIDIEAMAAIPTLEEQKNSGAGGGGIIVSIPEGTIAARTNNPLNIKYSASSPAGGKDSGIKGQDGGTFAAFDTPEEGLQAAVKLLQSSVYSGLTVDQAMKKWSNGGYGVEVSSSFKAEQKMSSLSESQMQQLVGDMAKRESGASIDYAKTDIQEIADAVISGNQPPDLKGLYGKSGPVKAEIQRRGFDLTKATLQWQAATKWISALNSSQMARFKTLGISVVNTIDEVKNLAEEMKLNSIPLVNKIQLEAYIKATGADSAKGQLAAQYLAATNTLKEEFANLAQGGYAPTEASWELASKQINENYDVNKLNSSLEEVQRLINYRLNAPEQTSPTVPGGGTNAYLSGSTSADNDPLGIR